MKIAILGGGVGAMTAAYCLTNPAFGASQDHQITIYQLGWRLGGKGASARNREKGFRIEEHGLHLWMGWYANAFRMMRTVYGDLDRPKDNPLATWQDAFKPQNVFTLMERRHDQWMKEEWMLAYPAAPGHPGDQTGFPTPCGYIGTLTHWAHERIDRFLEGFEHSTCLEHPAGQLPEAHRLQLHSAHAALEAARTQAGEPHQRGTRGNAGPLPHHHVLLALALDAAQKTIGLGLDLAGSCSTMQRILQFADLAVTIALGVIRDLCGTTDWTIIDDEEWRSWLMKNGLHKASSWSPVIRSFYDFHFAYRFGVATEENANLPAGTATCEWLRIGFDYCEGLFMKMQAAMGETIFTPLYEWLKSRGVKFEFFHRLRDVIPSDDGMNIDELRIGVQATTIDGGEYRPLFDFKGVGCWPPHPFYEQLVQGEELERGHIDLEDYDARWQDVGELNLRRGQDFDLVVFGLSIGAVPYVCKQILEQKKTWREMVQHIEVIDTQAFQFWFERNLADLGWPPALDGRCFGMRALVSTFVEPMATWADLSHLLAREGWNVPVKNASYFCGPIATGSTYEDVVNGAKEYIRNAAPIVWPYATEGDRFRYDWLAVNAPAPEMTGEERFAYQYFRVNTQPTEKYVLSVAGTTKYRLEPANSGYTNMVLAGDWLKTGVAVGCVESAVLGGMRAVRPHCPDMVIVE